MTWTLHEMTKALHEAQMLAIGARERVYIVAQGSRLKATMRPLPTDNIIVKDVVPPCENWDAKRIAREALEEFPDARPALERMLDIIDKDGNRKTRSPEMKSEAFAALISCYESAESSSAYLERKNDPHAFLMPWTREHRSLWQNIRTVFRA